MSNPIFQSLLLFGMVIAVVLFVYDSTKWRALGSLISRKTKGFRIALLILIESLIALLLCAPIFFKHATIRLLFFYWCLIVVLIIAILMIALLDVREVIHCVRLVNRENRDSMKRDLLGK